MFNTLDGSEEPVSSKARGKQHQTTNKSKFIILLRDWFLQLHVNKLRTKILCRKINTRFIFRSFKIVWWGHDISILVFCFKSMWMCVYFLKLWQMITSHHTSTGCIWRIFKIVSGITYFRWGSKTSETETCLWKLSYELSIFIVLIMYRVYLKLSIQTSVSFYVCLCPLLCSTLLKF